MTSQSQLQSAPKLLYAIAHPRFQSYSVRLLGVPSYDLKISIQSVEGIAAFLVYFVYLTWKVHIHLSIHGWPKHMTLDCVAF